MSIHKEEPPTASKTQILQIDLADAAEVRRLVASLIDPKKTNTSLDSGFIDVLIHTLSNSEYAPRRRDEEHNNDVHSIETFVNIGSYIVNIPRSILISLCLALDIAVSNGAANVLLAAFGVHGQSIYRINNPDLLCNAILLMVDRKDFHIDYIKRLKGNKCINIEFECQHKNIDNICNIDIHSAENNFEKIAKMSGEKVL